MPFQLTWRAGIAFDRVSTCTKNMKPETKLYYCQNILMNYDMKFKFAFKIVMLGAYIKVIDIMIFTGRASCLYKILEGLKSQVSPR